MRKNCQPHGMRKCHAPEERATHRAQAWSPFFVKSTWPSAGMRPLGIFDRLTSSRVCLKLRIVSRVVGSTATVYIIAYIKSSLTHTARHYRYIFFSGWWSSAPTQHTSTCSSPAGHADGDTLLRRSLYFKYKKGGTSCSQTFAPDDKDWGQPIRT